MPYPAESAEAHAAGATITGSGVARRRACRGLRYRSLRLSGGGRSNPPNLGVVDLDDAGVVTTVVRLMSSAVRRVRDSGDVLALAVMGVLGLLGGALAIAVAGGGTFAGGLARVVVLTIVVGLAMALQRRHPLVGGVPALAIAAIAVAIGQGLGFGVRDGLEASAGSLAATVVLGSAVAVVVLTLARMVWSLRTPVGRVLMVALLLGLALGARTMLIAPVADAIRMTTVPRTSVSRTTPSDLGLAHEDVTFVAEDGTSLSGWYIPSSNGAAVVLAHGSSASRSSVLPDAVVLARHGYGVLVFDARGQGRSSGRAMDLGWYGDSDLRGAVSLLAARDDVDPDRIGIVGISLGGEAAIGTAATDDRVRAVVADGAMYRRLGDWTPHHDEGPAGAWKDWLMFTTADLLSAARPPIALLEAVEAIVPRRVLLVASGAGDEIVAARQMQLAAPDTVEMWAVPEAGHTGELAARPAEWEAHVVGFLDVALAPSPVTSRGSIDRSEPG
jgi:uncharacterized protein